MSKPVAIRSNATLTISVRPDDATIAFAGLEKSFQQGMSIEPGRYLMQISASSYHDSKVWVEVSPGMDNHFSFQLEPVVYPITIGLWPYGTDVTILSGDNVLEQGRMAEQLSTHLPQGQYRLIVEKAGYKTQQRQFEVGPQQATLDDYMSLLALPKTAGDTFSDALSVGSNGPELVVIPTGKNRIGDVSGTGLPREQPAVEVEQKVAIAMGRYEVTQRQFLTYLQASGRPILSANLDQLDYPATEVSWNDAMAYTQWLSEQTGERYRLPSEAEWEYAARAGQAADFVTGDAIECTDARYDGLFRCEHDGPTKVGAFSANAFGLFDVHGNVWEWVLDCYYDDHSGRPSDTRARLEDGCERRTIRSGSWMLNSHKVRLSYRNWRFATYAHTDTGFRVVREL